MSEHEQEKPWRLEAAEPTTKRLHRPSLYADIIRDFLDQPAGRLPEAVVRLNEDDTPEDERRSPKVIFSGLYKAAKAPEFLGEAGQSRVKVSLRRGEPVLIRLDR